MYYSTVTTEMALSVRHRAAAHSLLSFDRLLTRVVVAETYSSRNVCMTMSKNKVALRNACADHPGMT
jgi:hypothetical protein